MRGFKKYLIEQLAVEFITIKPKDISTIKYSISSKIDSSKYNEKITWIKDSGDALFLAVKDNIIIGYLAFLRADTKAESYFMYNLIWWIEVDPAYRGIKQNVTMTITKNMLDHLRKLRHRIIRDTLTGKKVEEMKWLAVMPQTKEGKKYETHVENMIKKYKHIEFT